MTVDEVAAAVGNCWPACKHFPARGRPAAAMAHLMQAAQTMLDGWTPPCPFWTS